MRSFVSWYWQRSHQLWPRVLNAIGRMLLSRSGSSAGVQPILHESQLSFLRSGHTNWPREAGCFGLDFRRRFDRRSLWIGRAFAGIVQRFSRSLISIELLWCFVFERPRRATDDLLCVRVGPRRCFTVSSGRAQVAFASSAIPKCHGERRLDARRPWCQQVTM